MKVSESYRNKLRQICLDLIDSGINCLPRWLDSQAPAFSQGERYQKFFSVLIRDSPDDREMIARKFDSPRVGGIVVVYNPRTGILPIDADHVKVVDLEASIKKVVSSYGHAVYFDRRISSNNLKKYGLHIVAFAPKEVLLNSKIRIVHGWEGKAEFAVKIGCLTVYPSLRLDRETGDLSVYYKLSRVELKESLYDEKLNTIPSIVKELGGKLIVEQIMHRSNEGAVPDRIDPGTPYHGLSIKLAPDQVPFVIYNFLRLTGCPGEVVDVFKLIFQQKIMAIPYFIYSAVVMDTDHPRSSWTILENYVGRLLGELGAGEEALAYAESVLRESEEAYLRANGPVDHRTLRRNLVTAYRFREFGHDRVGACIFKILNICHEPCNKTLFLKLSDPASRMNLMLSAEAAKDLKEIPL